MGTDQSGYGTNYLASENVSSSEHLPTLLALSPLLSSPLDLYETFQAIVQAALNLLGISAGMLAVDAALLDKHPSEENATLPILPSLADPQHVYRVVAAIGLEHGPQIGEVFYSGQSLPGRVVRDGIPLLVNNLAGDPRFQPWYAGGYTPASALYVPLRDQSTIYGTLAVAGREAQCFTEADLLLLSVFAEQASQTLLKAHLHRQTEETARLKERARLTRDLHAMLELPIDGMLQQLRELSEHYQRLIAQETGESQLSTTGLYDRLAEIGAALNTVLEEARQITHNLHTLFPVQKSLTQLVEEALLSIERCSQMSTRLIVEGTQPALSYQIVTTLLAIINEGLQNSALHAHARHVRIALRYGTDTLIVTIEDDGIGIGPSALPAPTGSWHRSSHHGGLLKMCDAAHSLGGVLTVTSTAGTGTRIIILLPLRSAAISMSAPVRHPSLQGQAQNTETSLIPARPSSLSLSESVAWSPANVDSVQRERERLYAELTPREWEILTLLGQGLRNREIANRLVITPKTVSFHITGLYQKLGVASRVEALRKVVALGLLTLQ